MNTFHTEIVAEIRSFSGKLSNTKLLLNIFWVLIDDNKIKTIYVFRENGELLIVRNGMIEKATWAYIGASSIFIEAENGWYSFLCSHGFLDSSFLLLKISGQEGYAFLVSEYQYDRGMNSKDKIEDKLRKRYVKPQVMERIPDQKRTESPLEEMPTYFAVNEKTNFLRRFVVKFEVVFSEGVSGEIYLNKKNKTAYFKKRGKWLGFSYKCRYKNPRYCINALYHYLVTREMLNEELLRNANEGYEDSKGYGRNLKRKEWPVPDILSHELDEFYE